MPPLRFPLVLRLRGFESSVSEEQDDSVDFLLSLKLSMKVKTFVCFLGLKKNSLKVPALNYRS